MSITFLSQQLQLVFVKYFLIIRISTKIYQEETVFENEI